MAILQSPREPAQTAPRRGLLARWARPLTGMGIALIVTAAAIALAGFGWFIWSVPTDEVVLSRSADGIVVLTGGTSRVTDAMELLAAGRGKRLLISGVHPSTTMREIARVVPAYEALLECCVDLDHSAENTVGNAVETRRWAKARGFRSLIVVTSNYHMPRTMMELGQQLPEVELIPFPVISDRQRAEGWWTAPTARLLISEYLKYLIAQVRIRFEPLSEIAGDRRLANN
jgi:uncharacterized SAM-binding protein YcdF (DUF218 family)